ncbi:MAG: hypothetical protein R2827_03225 [Bdellovibrionales bacterium]
MKIRVRFYHWYPKLIGVGAITLYPYILVSTERFQTPDCLLRHELEHVYQVRKLGWFKFYFLYLKDYIVGLFKYRNHNLAYLNISFEIEARKSESQALNDEQRFDLNLT